MQGGGLSEEGEEDMGEEEYEEGRRPPGRSESEGSKCLYEEMGAKYMV